MQLRWVTLCLLLALVCGQFSSWWFPCAAGCEDCWWSYDINYCNSCVSGSNRDYNNWWGWYASCYCSAGYYDNGGVVCPQCNYNCGTCSTGSYCDTCNGGANRYGPGSCGCLPKTYDAGYLASCYPCSYNCASCYSSASACTSCEGNRGAAPTCACLTKYYDAGSIASCQACARQCATCSSSSTVCTSCEANRVSTPVCACVSKYYDNGSSSACLACNYKCATCLSTSTTCTACEANRGSTPGCACLTKYYDAGSIIACLPCNYNCATCATSASVCTSCEANRVSTPTCICLTKYYDAGTIAVCLACAHQCATCSTSSTVCTSCQANRVSTPTCACLTKFYDDGTTPACLACNYKCATCLSSTNCTSCNSAALRGFVSTSLFCVCPDRYYDPGVETCASCHQTCFRCSAAAASNCLACNSAAFRVLSSSTCVCKGGFYETNPTVELCAACDFRCLTCAGSATTCLTCDSSLNRQLTTSACPCKPLFFQNITQLCEPCHPSCSTCTNRTACVSCLSAPLTSLNSSGLCSCTSAQYWTGAVCAGCSFRCLTCVGSGTNCTSCPVGSLRIYAGNACPCPTRYYDAGAVVCLACSYRCLTCAGAAATCGSCDAGMKRGLSGSTCPCLTGYYDDGSSSACLPCSYKCLTCSSASSCATCNSSLARTLNASTLYCECQAYYFQSGFQCYPCLSTCLTCTNNATCTACDSGLLRTLNASTRLCDCQVGYYDNGGVCTVCPALCTACTSGAVCTACKTGLNRQLTASSGSCDCVSGYILVLPVNTCQVCQYSCLTCLQNYTTRCATCQAGSLRNLNATTYQCACPDGYYDDGSSVTCLACPYSCATCSSASLCLTCPLASNRLLNSTSKSCPCLQHFFDAVSLFVLSPTCLPCVYYCSTCVNSSACATCNASNFRLLTSTGQCDCMGGYYDDNTGNETCAACAYTCQSCADATVCLTCSTANHRTTPGASCPCINGYFNSGTSPACVACNYSCATCTKATACVSCEAGYQRVSNSTTKLCSCKGRYYDAGVAICGSCSYSCLTCVSSASNCLTCNATAFRTYNSTTKSCPCNVGYYDSASQLCLRCHYSCLTCGNNKSCLTCNPTVSRVISSLTGLCVCMVGFYDDNVTQPCKACQGTCLGCINATHCTSCNATRYRTLNASKDYANATDTYCPCLYKYYSLGITANCASCHYSCSYCSGPLPTNCLFCTADSQRKLTPLKTCPCSPGYYDTNTTQPCPPCDPACLTCHDGLPSTCFTCNATTFYMSSNTTCYVNCPLHFFNNLTTMLCDNCSQYCLTCLSQTLCTSCQSPGYLRKSICVLVCPLGEYKNDTLRECLPCKVGCANCSTSRNCFKCVNSSYFVEYNTTLCMPCSGGCLTCFGPEGFQCLNCTYPLYLAQGQCVPLACPFGKYVDTFKGCLPCSGLHALSLTCNLTHAFLCEGTAQLRNHRCLPCNSVPGYAIDSTGDCSQICGDGVVYYYQCDDGNLLAGDGCSPNCLIESGWTCSNVTGPSKCQLEVELRISLDQWVKYPGRNEIRLALVLSLPLRLTRGNFGVRIGEVDAGLYDYQVEKQSDLSKVVVTITYRTSVAGKELALSYTEDRRLQQGEGQGGDKGRVLAALTFSTSLTIDAFPPAELISDSTLSFSSAAASILFWSAVVLAGLNLLIIPRRYALHSVTLLWLPSYLYMTLALPSPASSQWFSSTLLSVQYPAFFYGFSLGSCCVLDPFFSTSSEILSNVGYLLCVLVFSWLIWSCFKLRAFCSPGGHSSRSLTLASYYLLTLHLLAGPQLLHAAVRALADYQLVNLIDAANTTLAVFVVFCMGFAWAAVCFVTYGTVFEVEGEGDSKAATRQTEEKEVSEEPEEEPEIIVADGKELGELSSSQFNKSTTFLTRTHSTMRSTKKVEAEVEQEEEPFFSFDYCLLYRKHAAAKYYLPVLWGRLLLAGLLSAALTASPLPLHVLCGMLCLFNIAFLRLRPFRSTFTLVRILTTQLLLLALHSCASAYFLLARQSIYNETLDQSIVVLSMAVLLWAIISSLVEHYRIWIHAIWICCQDCVLAFRLRGKSVKIYERGEREREEVVRVEAIEEGDVVEADAFYARVLQKQAINQQYRKERRQPGFDKGFS